MYLNEATLLNNVRLRYGRDAIYVSHCKSFVNFQILNFVGATKENDLQNKMQRCVKRRHSSLTALPETRYFLR